MNTAEPILENILRDLPSGLLSKTGDERVDYYAASAVNETAHTLRNLRLARIFQDPGWKANLSVVIDRLNSVLEATKQSTIAQHESGVAEAVSKLTRSIQQLREVEQPATKMAAG